MTSSENSIVLSGESLLNVFTNQDLFHQALTHKSYHNENYKMSKGHNERLEYLGDAVLDLVLSDYLYHSLPDLNEGELSKLRASLVNETALTEIALTLDLGSFLKLGKGEVHTGGENKPRLLSSCFEALIGALYIDQGFDKTKKFILEIFKAKLNDLDLSVHFKSDYKTRLQEALQELKKKVPVYEIEKEVGPDHEKTFYISLKLDGALLAEGVGKSKKQAEQDAAKKALQRLNENLDQNAFKKTNKNSNQETK